MECVFQCRCVLGSSTFFDVKVPVNPIHSANDGALIRRWAVDGLEIALKPSIDVAENNNSTRLVRLMQDYVVGLQPSLFNKHGDLFLVYPSRQYVPEHVWSFVDTFQNISRKWHPTVHLPGNDTYASFLWWQANQAPLTCPL